MANAGELEALAKEAEGGSQQAFLQLAQRLHEPTFSLCARMLGGNEFDADDAFYEVLGLTWSLLRERRRNDPVDIWMYAAAAKVCIDRLHHDAITTKKKIASDTRHPSSAEPSGPALEPIPRCGAMEELSRLREALDMLPWEPRATVMLMYFGGFDPAQAARVLGVAPEALGRRLDAAKRILRAEFGGKEVPAPPDHLPAGALSLLAEGLANTRDQDEWMAHVGKCTACRRLWEQYVTETGALQRAVREYASNVRPTRPIAELVDELVAPKTRHRVPRPGGRLLPVRISRETSVEIQELRITGASEARRAKDAASADGALTAPRSAWLVAVFLLLVAILVAILLKRSAIFGDARDRGLGPRVSSPACSDGGGSRQISAIRHRSSVVRPLLKAEH